jgi:hypothetical protein
MIVLMNSTMTPLTMGRWVMAGEYAPLFTPEQSTTEYAAGIQ